MAVDWTNPCARAAALSSAYYQLISGGQEVEIRTRTLDAEEGVKFSTPNLAELKRQLEIAKAECEALTGATTKPRRYCFTGG